MFAQDINICAANPDVLLVGAGEILESYILTDKYASQYLLIMHLAQINSSQATASQSQQLQVDC